MKRRKMCKIVFLTPLFSVVESQNMQSASECKHKSNKLWNDLKLCDVHFMILYIYRIKK